MGEHDPSVLSPDILDHLRRTVLPGAELVTGDAVADEGDLYWTLTWTAGGTAGPTWVVPQQSRYGLPYLEKWLLSGPDERWRRLVEGYRTGSLGGPGIHRLLVPPGRRADWEAFGWRNPIPPLVVAYIGGPRAWRKLVAGLIQRETAIPAMVVKVPLVETAKKYLRDEVAILNRLATEKPGMAPRSLQFDEVQGIAVEEAVNGLAAGPLLEPLHLPYLIQLAIPGRTISLRRRHTDLKARVDRLARADAGVKSIFARALEALDDDREIPAVWVHGDLHAGNMVLRKDGRLQAVDWAFAHVDGLPFYDIVRARLMVDLEDGDQALTLDLDDPVLGAYARALDVDPALAGKIVTLYAARRLAKLLDDGDMATAAIVERKLGAWMR